MELETRLTLLEKKMDKIIDLLEHDGKKIRDHIDFIEHVYETIKAPFFYIMNKVSYKTIENV